MTINREPKPKQPLELKRPGRLELRKTAETGQVWQSFSRGRSKSVTVEVKRKRTFAPDEGGRMTQVSSVRQTAERAFAGRADAPTEVSEATLVDAPKLTSEERAARVVALEAAEKHAEERRRKEEATAGVRQQSEAVVKSSGQTVASASAVPGQAGRRATAPHPKAPGKGQLEDNVGDRVKRKPGAPKPTSARLGEPRRRQAKLTISQALEGDEHERMRSLGSVRRHQEKLRAPQEKQAYHPPGKVIRDVTVPEAITVRELANRMAERGSEVIKTLMNMGVMTTLNQVIGADTAELVVTEFGHRLKRIAAADVELGLKGEPDKEGTLQTRPPVVTIMGHVDHGKTSLLDALRETDVAAHEAGGITQHIGAYQVKLGSGDKITFIDTPGHAAFTEMRSRGAHVTDIVILVVAADDGIKDQSIEAINHARAAEVPIIVAINKIDRPEANPNRVREELLQHGLVVEEMGGDILAVDVSARRKQNLDKLEEAILLQAELLELKANSEGIGEAVVIEAKLERGRGSVATILVQRGTVRVGDIFVTGSQWGRVRALVDVHGEKLDAAGPAVPVEVLGLNGTPLAGDDFVVVENEARAREIARFRENTKRNISIAAQGHGSLERMLSKIKEGEAKELPVVIKSDVHGSLEAIIGSLGKMGTEEVKVRVLHAAVGGINESDVTLARASDATVIAFNARANPQAREMARRDNVDIRYYSIIYEVLDDLRAALTSLLTPLLREKTLGYADVREVFSISKVGKVAGCMVTEGLVRRGAKVRLLRDDAVIHNGTLKTLRRFKDELKEVKEGYECGMAFENYQDIQVGDRMECYEVEQVARTL